MPTGYTAGIIDGTTKTFLEYAKHCSRAFMVHLRDEPFDSKYKPRTPSDYHINKINDAKKTLQEIEFLEDSVIIQREEFRLLESIDYHKDKIEKDKKSKKRLEEFLLQAEKFIPPTEAHNGISDFLVSQIKETINFDFNSDYHFKELSKAKIKLLDINPNDIRGQLRTQSTKDLAYHTKEHELELKRCRDHNKWYDDFIKAVEKIQTTI